MERIKNPRIMFIVPMLIFGTLGIFVRNISVSSAELALYRACLADMLIGIFLFFTKQKIDFKTIKKEIPLLLISGAALGFNWIFLFEAYKYTTISIATLCYYFAPIIVTVLCPVLFKEKLGPMQILCFLMSTLGILLITGIGDLKGSEKHFIGIIFGLAAAFLYASIILINKHIKNIPGIHRTFLQFAAAIIVLLPYVITTEDITLFNLDLKGYINLLIVGIIHTGVVYCMYFTALEKLKGQETAILSYIDPLVAVIISVTVLGEEITLLQTIGGILILGFTLLNEILSKDK